MILYFVPAYHVMERKNIIP